MANLLSLTQQFRQLYRKVFPIPCLLCGLATDDQALCESCIAELPVIQQCCIRCAIPLANAQICGQCLKKPPIQDISLSLYRYEQAIPRMMSALKYHRQIQLAEMCAQEFISYHTLATLPDVLLPIPLHPSRLRQRGYNQSLLFADSLAKLLKIPCRPELLKRIKKTATQTQLNAKQRHKNMRQAFEYSSSFVPQHVAIIDDVMTSGATTHEAARVLKRVGVETIEVWTIARAISHY
ncbi:ComF family protein [Methylophaga sulfidovorans]|uniref:ComF family protein n=1 Tax=Methylophaga sulfidovorans TaxID=45496 RepID=A0A1I3TVG8_9GAMM|nr:ComF family protein [Methylophaga sulfidovorans]SFJ74319.1 comF family protein [Methylophaga sulfidovorans]